MSCFAHRRWLRIAGPASILFVLMVLGATSGGYVLAQTASVRGIAVDAETGRPLSGANVTLRRDEEVVRGTATGRDGTFLVTDLEPTAYVLEVTYLGYRAHRDTLALTADESREVEAALVPSTEELDDILVEASGRAGAADVQAGYQRLEAEDLERIPTPGLSADLASYVGSQPGVVSIGDRGGGLYVRGGEPSQNRLFVDRIPVYQPFHMIGFYSAIPASIVRETDFYAGGYPAAYSGGLSSVIDVGTRTGNMQEYEASASLSPFLGSVTLDGPLRPGRVSVLGSYRRSMLEHGASRYVDSSLPFRFSDGFGKVYGRISPTRQLTGSAVWSADAGRIGSSPRDSTAQEVRWANSGGSLRYLFIPSALLMQGEAFLAVGNLTSEVGPPDRPVRRSNVRNVRLGVRGSFPGETFAVDAGFTTSLIALDTRLGGFFQNAETGAALGLTQTAFFLTPRFELLSGDRLRIEPGTRLQFYSVRFEPYVEPRLRISYELADQELSFAGGLFHQELLGLTDRRDAASVFTAWTGIPGRRLGLSEGLEDVLFGRIGRAYHLAGSYRIRPAPGLEAAVGGFYRSYENLFVQEWTSLVRFSPRLQPATGRSYGATVRLELQRGSFYGFVNYGYSNTRYAAENARFDLWYGEETMNFRPPHDQRHQFNALAEFRRWGFSLTLRLSAASGRPFSRPVGFDGFAFLAGFESQFRTDSERRVVYEEPFNAVLPAYHRLDVSVERTFDLRGGAGLTVQGSVINAYDRANIFYVDVYTRERRDQLPVVPSVGVELTLDR